MKNKELDANLFKDNDVSGGLCYYPVPSEKFDLYGVFYEKDSDCFVRMPKSVAENVSKGVKILYKMPTGGRLRFSTDSSEIALRVGYDSLFKMTNMPLVSSCGFTLLEDTDDGYRFASIFKPTMNDETGYFANCKFSEKKMRRFTLFFPVYNEIRSLEIGLEKNCTLGHGKKYGSDLPVLYYGSSITQGCCCSRCDNTYPALISKQNNMDFINLGFSGNAKAEDPMIDYLADIDCSVFVCDYDYNAETAEELDARHFNLYERYRRKRKTTPIVFVSKPDFYGKSGDIARREIILTTYKKALASGDKGVYFVDGANLLGSRVHDATVDGCHPNDHGFSLMSEQIGKVINEILSVRL